MNKSEFARYCGVTPTAITAATRDGRILISADGSINPNANKNKQYKAIQNQRKEKTAKGKSERTPKAQRNPENRQRLKRIEITPDDLNMLSPDDPLDDPRGGLDEPDDDPGGFESYERTTEIDYAIEKMRSTTALNKARLAAMVSATIRRDFVDEVISLIGTCISDHLITMGDRLSPDIAAIVGSTEASVIRRVKEEIDADVRGSIEEMKLVIQKKYHDRIEA